MMCNRLWMPITEHEVGILSAEYESRLGPVVMLAMTTRALYIIKAFGICSLSMGHGGLHGIPDGFWGTLGIGYGV